MTIIVSCSALLSKIFKEKITPQGNEEKQVYWWMEFEILRSRVGHLKKTVIQPNTRKMIKKGGEIIINLLYFSGDEKVKWKTMHLIHVVCLFNWRLKLLKNITNIHFSQNH